MYNNYTVYSKGLLSSFKPTTLEEVGKLILSSPNKQCVFDPVPKWLRKKYCKVLAPFLVQVFNKSLGTSDCPEPLKSAVVTPIIKKPQLPIICLIIDLYYGLLANCYFQLRRNRENNRQTSGRLSGF